MSLIVSRRLPYEFPRFEVELRDDIGHAATETRRRIEGESIEESIQTGKAEARRFQESMR